MGTRQFPNCSWPACSCRGSCNLYRPGWRRVYEGKPCTYCQRPMKLNVPDLLPTHDHVESCAHGGSNDPANIVLACARCNRVKDSQTLEQFWSMLKARGEHEWAKHVGEFIANRKPSRNEEAA